MNTCLVENLRAMRELLSVPERWTQGWFAKDNLGKDTDLDSTRAVCWCLAGAAARITGDPFSAEIKQALGLPSMYGSVAMFNDAPTTTHADVLTLLDRAIAKAEAS